MRWSAGDSIAGCPAGDTVVVNHPGHPHPSRLRIPVEYFNSVCDPRAGVPPDSIWVTYFTSSGNARVNDKSDKVFADDSTDGCGFTRITIPSLSGCGTVTVFLYVSGVLQGSRSIVVRTTDTNADGRATDTDVLNACDLDYNGSANAGDGSIVLGHPHWHRHALHGTLVRRTNLRNSGSGLENNAIGNGGIFWSPNGRRIVYSARDTCPPPTCSAPKNPCRIKWVFSDPALGNDVFNLTFNSDGGSLDDYDPSWSPLGGYVYYVRADRVIRRKGVPGLNPDVSDVAIIAATGSALLDKAQISPDGDSLAFAENAGDFRHIFIAPATGGSKRQLTSGDGGNWTDPHWSPDGRYLIASREQAGSPFQSTLHKINVQGNPPPARFYPVVGDNSTDARWPAVSADSQIVVAGVGPNPTSPHTTHTIEGAVSTTGVAIQNYPAHTFFPVYPRLSPDGTRLALLGKDPAVAGATLPQVWAVRRNMNAPPQITNVGTQNVADSTVVVAISAKQGLQTNVQILASDPEGDPITCRAAYLNDGMTFNPANCTLTWTPSAPVGTKFHVVFRVATTTWPNASGGSDGIIGEFTVTDPLLAPGLSLSPPSEEGPHEADGPNPTSGTFALRTPLVAGAMAELGIFDLSGRRIALVRGRAGSRLVWSGETSAGTRVPSGVYLYRLTAGTYLKTGRVVHVR